ncbi:hypothetical protein [Caballeronia sp. dw_19]|uniref:hypothetical protein n=1 Tax=Caballeronia sp. dw_19 TaxID=2719791 RepID=UPI001BCC0C95|nr:hypothetical protein [Caballeronia sp. dw_19]
MNDSFTSEPPEDSRATVFVGPMKKKESSGRAPSLYIVSSDPPRKRKLKAIRVSSHVTIAVNVDGYMEFDSNFAPEDADRMVDALLVMLVKARRAAS